MASPPPASRAPSSLSVFFPPSRHRERPGRGRCARHGEPRGDRSWVAGRAADRKPRTRRRDRPRLPSAIFSHLAHARASDLSYGDQRRVEIARALASTPKLLLLDEPAAGMNPTERKALAQLIRRISATGITVVIVEHDINLIMGISDQVLVLESGVVIASGKPEMVRRDPKVVEAYIGCRTAVRASASSGVVVSAPGPPILELKDVRLSYGPIEAVHGIDLSVGRGEIVT